MPLLGKILISIFLFVCVCVPFFFLWWIDHVGNKATLKCASDEFMDEIRKINKEFMVKEKI